MISEVRRLNTDAVLRCIRGFLQITAMVIQYPSLPVVSWLGLIVYYLASVSTFPRWNLHQFPTAPHFVLVMMG